MRPNNVTLREGYHISYNALDTNHYGSPTTALVAADTTFYILNGDHQAALAALDWAGCVRYLHDHALELNAFSEYIPAIGCTLADVANVYPSKIYCPQPNRKIGA